MNTIQIWDVWGTFILPGTRDKLTLERTRVIAKDRQQASADVAGLLQSKFRDKLPRDRGSRFSTFHFSKNFALMNLQWKQFQSPPIQQSKPNTKEPAPVNKFRTMVEGLFTNPFETPEAAQGALAPLERVIIPPSPPLPTISVC